jgi:hypothetical protein
MITLKMRWIIVSAAAILLLALAAGWSLGMRQVTAQSESIMDPEGASPQAASAPVPGGPGFYMLPATAFRPRSHTTGYEIIGPQLRSLSGTAPIYYDAPLNLPSGARITRFIVYFLDNDGGQNITAEIFRAELPGDAGQGMVTPLVSSGSSSTPTYLAATNFIVSSVVDNSQYAYYARILLPIATNLKLNGIRIDYTFDSALPVVIK